MKLVSAKCPNCGANIDVDKDSQSTVCGYCKSKIIIDDAIAKYKIEIEIKNLPKLDNFLTLGKKHYKNLEYEEAYNSYSKALELDPNNSEAVLYKGICKALCTNYKDFEILVAFNATKNALDILDESKENIKESYILELFSVTVKLEKLAIDFYKKYNLTLIEVEQFIDKLKSCLEILEYCYRNIISKENKILILNKIIGLIDYILKRKIYITDAKYRETYIQNFKDKVELIKKKKNYTEKLFELDPNSQKEKNKRILLISFIIIEVFILFASLLSFINCMSLIWGFLFLVDFIIIIPFISKKIFKNKKIGLLIKILIFTIAIIGSINNGYPEFSNQIYYSNTTDMIIEFDKKKVFINDKQTKYEYEDKDSYFIIYIDNQKFKYKKDNNRYLFCLLEGDSCKHYFSSNYISHEYITTDE